MRLSEPLIYSAFPPDEDWLAARSADEIPEPLYQQFSP
jgi:hypothetical protein